MEGRIKCRQPSDVMDGGRVRKRKWGCGEAEAEDCEGVLRWEGRMGQSFEGVPVAVEGAGGKGLEAGCGEADGGT